MSGKREPKRSENLPTCQESNVGSTSNIAANNPTIKGWAPSFSA